MSCSLSLFLSLSPLPLPLTPHQMIIRRTARALEIEISKFSIDSPVPIRVRVVAVCSASRCCYQDTLLVSIDLFIHSNERATYLFIVAFESNRSNGKSLEFLNPFISFAKVLRSTIEIALSWAPSLSLDSFTPSAIIYTKRKFRLRFHSFVEPTFRRLRPDLRWPMNFRTKKIKLKTKLDAFGPVILAVEGSLTETIRQRHNNGI